MSTTPDGGNLVTSSRPNFGATDYRAQCQALLVGTRRSLVATQGFILKFRSHRAVGVDSAKQAAVDLLKIVRTIGLATLERAAA